MNLNVMSLRRAAGGSFASLYRGGVQHLQGTVARSLESN